MWLTNDWIRSECHPMGGKIASPSLLLAPQHILSSSVSWVALFLSDVSLSVKSFSYISSSLAISHPSTFLISYFLHDTTPFISLIQSGLHSCFTQVKADIFFFHVGKLVWCWAAACMQKRDYFHQALRYQTVIGMWLFWTSVVTADGDLRRCHS